MIIEPVQLTTLLGLGFILGLKHSLDADHIAAVSTIISGTRNTGKSSLIGAVWGVGHTVTLLLAGIAVLVFKLTIPEKVALSFEFLVGGMLVVLGGCVFKKIIGDRLHIHRHEHDDIVHLHVHSHKERATHEHTHKSFFVGMVHGLAGSAALMLIVLTTVNSVSQGILYILFFGIGSIAGMVVVCGIIGLQFSLLSRFESLNFSLRLASGAISIALGCMIMYRIGFAGIF